MKNYINSVQLIGHLGNDQEIKSIENGSVLTKMNLATNETYKDKEGNFQVLTQWHNITAWGSLAEHMSKKLSKGSHILVNGRIRNSSWQAQDGTKRYGTEIVVREYMLLDKKNQDVVSEAEGEAVLAG